MRNIITIFNICLCLLFAACRHEDLMVTSESEQTGAQAESIGGLYLLNEGNMGANKSTLDYYDFSSGVYSRNIYPERNPSAPMELGDVGNDLAVYGSKLYAVINCSHKVEVMDATTGVSLGKIDIPNCRFIKFHEGNAYISSYIGPVGADPHCPQGAVFRVDTLTLSITGQVTVGYQPEEMEIIGQKLYVANSGGYKAPTYDNTISVIDLPSFSTEAPIEAEINLFRLRKDNYGNLWASSRGNNADIPGRLLKLTPDPAGSFSVSRSFPYRCDNMALRGDSLLIISSSPTPSYIALDTKSGSVLSSNFITDGTDSEISRPYGIAVHPLTGDIFLTDAKNYVSSGTLYSFAGNGKKKWSVKTGDIPTAIAFTYAGVTVDTGNQEPDTSLSAYISKVFEYCPAPGQFINTMPEYSSGDSYQDMLRKCEESVCGASEGCISLGGFGGYITFGFDHTIENVPGQKDFRIWGNAVWQSDELKGGSAEPGIVMVSYDANGNGLPDDEWYELAGSEYFSNATIKNYSLTYYKGTDDEPLRWTDNSGSNGIILSNAFHSQNYWPAWIEADRLTFTGTLLSTNAVDQDGKGNNFILFSYPWGYADNYPNRFTDENSFDISWAVDSNGKHVDLPGINFVRVYTALNQNCGWLGETSTEICKAADLHILQTY